MISSSFTINTFNEENDPITQAYSEKPSQEQIIELDKSKGYTYQRKGKDQSQDTQVFSVRYKPDLKVDWVAWINNIKIFVPVFELLKSPSQRAYLFKVLGMLQQSYDRKNHNDK